MTSAVLWWLSAAFVLLSLAASFYTFYAARQVRALRSRSTTHSNSAPNVSILKPLYSAEAGLYENLASFCTQDYRGEIQILLGVRSPHDPAVPIVQRLIADHPACNLELVFTAGASSASNDKIANLVGTAARARFDVLVVSDSDIAVETDYVATTVAELERPGVGAVTWLYRGAPLAGLPSRLAGMAIDYHFLPSVLVGRALGLANPCFGSTIALTRATLTRIGGFEAFGEHLADDYAIGDAVRRAGLEVAIPSDVVVHACTERTFAELFHHELRWARTVRAVDPAGFAGTVLTHPIPLALIGACLAGFALFSLAAIALAVTSRLVLQRQVDHTFNLRPEAKWAALVRDVLSFAIYIFSFFVSVVRWRGRFYRVRADGTVTSVREV